MTIKPIYLVDGGPQRSLNTSVCGDNIYFFSNYSIVFVITETPNCLVRISLIDSIQLTTRFVMNASQFFVPTVFSSFITNLCALLNIQDTSRVKIVGVFSGSTLVKTFIDPIPLAAVSSGADSSMPSTQTALLQAISDGSFAANMTAGVGYMVLTASSDIHLLPGSTSEEKEEEDAKKTTLVIGLIVLGVVLLLTGLIITIYCIKRRNVKTDIKESEEEFHEEKSIEKDLDHFVLEANQSNVSIKEPIS